MRAHAHAAAGALLIFGAGDAGAAGGGDAVEAGQPVGIESRADGFALGVESGEFGGELLLAGGHAGADAIHLGGKQLHLGAGLGQRGFLRLGALQAGVFLIFQALGFGGFELDLVLDGRGLLGSGHGVELGAESGGLLAVGVDLALQAGAQRVFAAERGRGVGGLALGGGERGLGLGDFRGQRAQLLVEAGAV